MMSGDSLIFADSSIGAVLGTNGQKSAPDKASSDFKRRPIISKNVRRVAFRVNCVSRRLLSRPI